MKFLAWLFAIIAVILMIFGFIAFLIQNAFLGVNHAVNFFHVAISFLLLAMCCTMLGTCKKKE
ncbi:MAG: hypothetical protein JXB60_04905 [Candidatus Cloacimonetes bacterium]|nr:hypothetical protein [Candidatus Cloacimonadota bacterium]